MQEPKASSNANESGIRCNAGKREGAMAALTVDGAHRRRIVILGGHLHGGARRQWYIGGPQNPFLKAAE